jgi:competence protein ComEA
MNNSLDFSKKSRRAILIFLLLFLVVVFIPRAFFLLSPVEKFQFSQTDFEKKEFQNAQFKEYSKKSSFDKKKSKFSVPPSKFDPNQYAASDWMRLGLSEKQTAILLKFGKRGFYSDEDLKQVFVISDSFFALIKDSLVYPPRKEFATKITETKKVTILELNTASEEQLLSLKGVGAFFAKQIIKKRGELGGYISVDQLKEVWKMDEEKFEIIKPQVSVDKSLIQGIQINLVTAEELKAHPYISWNVANSLIKIRNQHGNFKSPEDLRKSVLVDDILFEKIKPYIVIE